MKHLFLLAIVGLLSTCATAAPKQSRMPFPEQEYLALAKTGSATVKGQAFVKTEAGDVKTAAGNEVILNPVTSYSMEWYEKAYLPARAMVEADPRLSKYILTQIVDSSGCFTFKNVPPGDYFVTTMINWEAPTGQGSMERRGGTISRRITVKDGQEIEVMVTP